MARVDELLCEYGESHRDRLNQAIHWLCVPLISFSTVGLLWTVPLGIPRADWFNLGSVLVAGAMVYYLALSLPLALGMAAFSAAIAVSCHALVLWSVDGMRIICAALFVLSWIAQFLGHRREGKKPAFLKDLQFLLIGPLWLLAKLVRR